MACVTGLVYQQGEFFEGYVELKDGTKRVGQGLREDAIAKGIIIPKFVNCHTHLGDAFIPTPQRKTVEELVAPPDGLKHRMLRQVSEEIQISSMRRTIEPMAESGTSSFIDFREGGLEGARRILKAAMGIGIRPVLFGRPNGLKYEKTEMATLLSVVDGIGVSAMSDWDYEELKAVAEHTGKAGKPFALHASEGVREDIDAILDLKPAFLVHMIKATDSDLDACVTSNVPIVVCPRANAFFGLRPPVERMMKAGIQICLGTDNAMFASPDMFSEMRALRSILSNDTLSDARFFEIVFDNCRKALNSILGLGEEAGEYPDFLVLHRPLKAPWKHVLTASAKDIRLVQGSGNGECGDRP